MQGVTAGQELSLLRSLLSLRGVLSDLLCSLFYTPLDHVDLRMSDHDQLTEAEDVQKGKLKCLDTKRENYQITIYTNVNYLT